MKASYIVVLVFAGVILVLLAGCSLADKPYKASVVQGAVVSMNDNNAVASLEQLSSWCEALYAAANNSNRQESFLLLVRIEELAAAQSRGETGTRDGWLAFKESVQTAKKAISHKGNTTLWYTEAARLKLASDALYQPSAPLWLQYEDVLRDDAQRILTAWQSMATDRAKAAEVAIDIYNEHVDRLEVAALMQRGNDEMAVVRQNIQYVRQVIEAAAAGQLRQDAVSRALSSLNVAANDLFRDPKAHGSEPAMAEALPPGMTVGKQRSGEMQLVELFIASFVMGVLGFAGWRKYRGQRDKGIPFSSNKFIQ